MALEQPAGADDSGVVVVEGIDLHVAVVAPCVVGVEGVFQAEGAAGLPFGHGAQPLHALGIDAICAVVVLEARGAVNAAHCAHGLEQRSAPVGAVHVLGLVFIRQQVREGGREVAQQRSGDLRGARLHAFHMAVRAAVVHVQPQVVVAVARALACNAAVQAYAGFAQAVAAQAQAAFGDGGALGGFGDVVHRAAHAARAIQKAGSAANGFGAVVNPAVHRAGGNAVLHVDAVEEVIDGSAREAPVAGADGAGRIAGGGARNALQHFLRGARAARLNAGAVHHGDDGRRLPCRQPQAAAGVGRRVQQDFGRLRLRGVVHDDFWQGGLGFGFLAVARGAGFFRGLGQGRRAQQRQSRTHRHRVEAKNREVEHEKRKRRVAEQKKMASKGGPCVLGCKAAGRASASTETKERYACAPGVGKRGRRIESLR